MTYTPDRLSSFDIRKHVHKLTPTKTKNKYVCPICGNNNLGVDPDNGAYQCWNGCENELIREAIAPWAEKMAEDKLIRPKADREWVYTDVDGNPVLKTRRLDDGQGKRTIWQEFFVNGQWVSGKKIEDDALKNAIKKSVAPYRYTDIKPLIDAGETILWVEGETCCDALWNIGIAATTSIGGSSAYDSGGSYAEILKGANLVICPDRDSTGMKYAERVAKDFPNAKWLYAFPESAAWFSLPSKQGLDIADWIESGATKEQILAAVGEKRDLKPAVQPTIPRPGAKINADKLSEMLCALLDGEALSASDLQTKLYAIAEKSGFSTKEVEALFNTFRQEREQKEINQNPLELLQLQQDSLSAHDYFAPELADALEQIADAMPTSVAWLITTLFPVLGSAIGNSSRLVVSRKAQYVVSPVVWTAIVAKSGQKKTPAQKQIVGPLTALEHEAFKEWARKNKDYNKDVAASARDKNAPEPGDAPQRERFLTNNATPEGLTRTIADSNGALLLYKDELAGFFRGMNQYKSKGSDEEFWLDLFNGQGFISDRANTEKSTVAERSNVGMTGSIQWRTLQEIQSKKGFNDDSGMFARFLMCADEAPLSLIDLSDDDDPASELPSILGNLYRRLRALPEHDYLLSKDARVLFQNWQHQLTYMANQEDHPGLALVYPKLETYMGRLALILHLTNATLLRQRIEPVISGETMQKAIRLTAYYLGQAKLVYGVNDPRSKDQKIIFEIVNKSRQSGKVSALRLKLSIPELNNCSVLEVHRYMTIAAEQGQGEIEKNIVNGREEWSFIAGDGLSKIHRQIINAAKRVKALTVGTARNSVYAMKNNPKQYTDKAIKKLFEEIAATGVARIEGEGRSLSLVCAEHQEGIRLDEVCDSDLNKTQAQDKVTQVADISDDAGGFSVGELVSVGDRQHGIVVGFIDDATAVIELDSDRVEQFPIAALSKFDVDTTVDVTPVLTVEEVDGFKVGDRVEITLDNFSPQEQKAIRREDGFVDGQRGKVVGFKPDPFGVGLMGCIVAVDGGETQAYPPVYLKKIEEES